MTQSLPPQNRVKSALIFCFKFVISGGLLWFILHDLELGKISQKFSTISSKVLFFAICLAMLQPLLTAYRWKNVIKAIHPGKIALFELVKVNYSSLLLSQGLPSSAGGDLYRIWFGRKYWGMGTGLALSCPLLERLFGLVVLALIPLYILIVGSYWHLPRELVGFILLSGLGSIICFLWLCFFDVVFKPLIKWGKISTIFVLCGYARQAFLNQKTFMICVVSSLGAHLLTFIPIYLLAQGSGIDVSLSQLLLALPIGAVSAIVPISIAGWGVRETVLISILGVMGISEVDAAFISISYGLLIMILSLPGAVFLLLPRENEQERSV